MQLDWAALLGPPDPARPWSLVANLPYNIATPLVLDLLRGGARHRAHGRARPARGGRAAGGRTGHQDLRHPVGEAGLVGRRRRRGQGARPACSSRSPGSMSAVVDLRRHAPAGAEAERAVVFDLIETGFNQRRKMLRRSLAAKASRPTTSRPPASAPKPGPRSSPSPTGSASPPSWPDPSRSRAILHAESATHRPRTSIDVTLVTLARARRRRRPRQAHPLPADHRRARRRLPPHRRRDGEPRPGRHPHLQRRRRPRGARRDRRRARRRRQPGAAGPAGGRPHRPRRARQADPVRAPASAAVPPTPPPCCAGRAATTSTWPRRLGADVPFCLVGRPGPRHGGRRAGRAAPVRAADLHPAHAAGALLDPGGVPRPGTTSAVRRPTAPTTSSRRRSSWRPSWPAGGTASATPPARRPCWPAAAAPGSSTGAHEGDGFVVVRTVRPPTCTRPERATTASRERRSVAATGCAWGRAGLLAGGPALPTRALQHLLVLLLAHALAALLDQ